MENFFEFIKTLEKDIREYLSNKKLQLYSELRINKYDPLLSLKILKSKIPIEVFVQKFREKSLSFLEIMVSKVN